MHIENYIISNMIEEILMSDKVYCEDLEDLAEIKERYESMVLPVFQRFIIDDYIECMKTVNERAKNILYYSHEAK